MQTAMRPNACHLSKAATLRVASGQRDVW